MKILIRLATVFLATVAWASKSVPQINETPSCDWSILMTAKTPVFAPVAGTVTKISRIKAGSEEPYKTDTNTGLIQIRSDDGAEMELFHLIPYLAVGQHVHLGQMIGLSSLQDETAPTTLSYRILNSAKNLTCNQRESSGELKRLTEANSITPSDWLDFWQTQGQFENPGKPYSVSTVSEESRHGGKSLRFELRKGETWNAGDEKTYRSELASGEIVPMNSVKWYGFSIFLPKDFPIEDNRLLLAQWWAITKWYLGEANRSPAMALRFVNGELRLTSNQTSDRIVHDPDAVPQLKLWSTRSFKLGQWNDFVVQVKWSYQADGFVNLWWNGKQVLKYKGPIEYNDDVGPMFKFGIYRNDTDAAYISYFSDCRMGESFEDVDPKRKR